MTIRSNVAKVARRTISVAPPRAQALLGHGGNWLARECAVEATAPAPPAPVTPEALLPTRPLPLPAGINETELRRTFSTWSIDGEPEGHMDAYVTDSFGRFVHTFGLVSDLQGTCLELGANPYFTTYLVDEYSDLELSLANYFENDQTSTTQTLTHRDGDGVVSTRHYDSKLFNIEQDQFPYDDDSFDVVMYCEIIEHLLMDPCEVLHKIRRILKPDGTLVLTTPNVARLNNVLRLAGGENLYDPYSGYGPYGRHNREYTMAELHALLSFMGFDIEQSFLADSHGDAYESNVMYPEMAPLLTGRGDGLGQYLFVRARVARPAREGLPDLFYRSWPAGRIVPTYLPE